MELEIVEVVSRTVQGEGKFIGTPISLIRLPGCNLKCSYCDTKYAWKEESWSTKISFEELKDNLPCTNVLITGGEPTIHKDFELLFTSLQFCGKTIHVETNGTNLKRDWALARDMHWCISPKLWSSGNGISMVDYGNMIRPFVISGANVYLKFVISDAEDMLESLKLLQEVVHKVPVFYQPVSNDTEMYKWMVENGPEDARYLLQLHKLAGMV